MSGNPLLQLDPGVAIWTLVVFAILLVVLKKTAWGPLLRAIDARDERLRSAMEEAERVRAENERAAGERDRLMRETLQRADAIVADARTRAEESARAIERRARDERREMIDGAEKAVESMRRAAREELRTKVADATVELASKLLRRELDRESGRRVVDGMIDELEAKG
jgi:F-type H+-transporting ATPase subunit b